MYALIDSNNFFVSCERLFRPELAHVPTIVLSSNDGCAISRSNEAKALGIKMGEPIFKLRNRFQIVELRDKSYDLREEAAPLRGSKTVRLQPDETSTPDSILSSVGVADIWGVGWKLAPKLKAEGVFTALELARLRPQRAQQLMGIHGRHMVYELNGIRCLPLQPKTKPQHMVSRGRQFGEDTSDFAVIEAAVTTLATRAARELRREGQLALRAGVSLRTNRHKPGYAHTFDSVRFYTPTADVGLICSHLIRTLQRTFKKGLSYHKAEVTLYELVPEQHVQTDVFGCVNMGAHDRSQRRMQAIDAINAAYGQNTIRPAAETLSRSWRPRSAMLSPRYTSSWEDLPIVSTPVTDNRKQLAEM